MSISDSPPARSHLAVNGSPAPIRVADELAQTSRAVLAADQAHLAEAASTPWERRGLLGRLLRTAA